MIPESHPLRQLFQELVGRRYAEEIGIRDPELVAYVSHLLAEFCESDQLFKIHDAADRFTVPLRRLTVSARYASILATTRCSLLECFPRASTASGCAGIAWKILWSG